MIGMNYRACVGKNLANLELQIFMATIFRRYTFVLENPEKRVSHHFTSPGHFPLIEFFFFARSSTLSRDSFVNRLHAESA